MQNNVEAKKGQATSRFTKVKKFPFNGEAVIMARDEARHGKAFAGLLERYFGK